jgi:hypothetical protein
MSSTELENLARIGKLKRDAPADDEIVSGIVSRRRYPGKL